MWDLRVWLTVTTLACSFSRTGVAACLVHDGLFGLTHIKRMTHTLPAHISLARLGRTFPCYIRTRLVIDCCLLFVQQSRHAVVPGLTKAFIKPVTG